MVLVVLSLMAWVLPVSAQTDLLDYLETKTYQWTGADGVTHTSGILDEATDPEQIYQFVRAVYMDRNIPGLINDPTPEELVPVSRGNSRTALYDMPDGYPQYEIPAGDYTPETEGLTGILVKIKNEVNKSLSGMSAKEAIAAGVSSVKLITSSVRLDEDPNPGMLFNVRDNLNRFFIMTKGKLRRVTGTPFFDLFEEFSPWHSNDADNYNAYDAMLRGEHYDIGHDCAGVFEQWHPTSMGGPGNEKFFYSNLLFFVPDKRFAARPDGSDPTVHSSGDYTFYNTEYSPYFLFYNINLRLDDVRRVDDYSATNRKVVVDLTWETDFHKILNGGEVWEQFRLYRVDGTGLKTPVGRDEIVITDPDVVLAEVDGLFVIHKKHHIVSLGVLEDQPEDGKTVRYIVEGTLAESNISYVESEPVTAVIPGYRLSQLCVLSVAGTPSSEFVYSPEGEAGDVNHYVNRFTLSANPAGAGNQLPADAVVNGSVFALNRRDDANTRWMPLSVLSITRRETAADGSVSIYGKVNDGAERLCFVADGENEPVRTADGEAEAVWFVDDFTANTAGNLHPETYYYYITTNIPVKTEQGSEISVESAVIEIDIPKSEVVLGFDNTYTADEIDELLPELELSRKNAGYKVVDNAVLRSFSVRLDNRTEISQTSRDTEGRFRRQDFVTVADGNNVWQPRDQITDFDAMQTFPLFDGADADGYKDAVVVITDRAGNTYGTGRAYMPGEMSVKAELLGIGDAVGEGDASTYTVAGAATPTVGAGLADSGRYNVWMAYDDGYGSVIPEDRTWWHNHINREKVVSAGDAYEGGLSVTHDSRPGWAVTDDRSLIVSMLVRHYPMVVPATAEREAAPARYAVTETYEVYDKKHGVVTGIDGVGGDNVANAVAEVYNLQGLKVMTATVGASGRPGDVDLSSLPKGIYIVKTGNSAVKVAN